MFKDGDSNLKLYRWNQGEVANYVNYQINHMPVMHTSETPLVQKIINIKPTKKQPAKFKFVDVVVKRSNQNWAYTCFLGFFEIRVLERGMPH